MLFRRLIKLLVLLSFVVVALGAYTRLVDGGLGCPDWPGCYGQPVVPESSTAIHQAHHIYPNQPIEPVKAWAEMIHRYFAGTFGALIVSVAVYGLFRRRHNKTQIIVCCSLIALVMTQAMLGMWTVTWQLHPLVVMGHLLGGMTLAALLWYLLMLDTHHGQLSAPKRGLHTLASASVAVVYLQIFLGGWVSANYASLSCLALPLCHGHWYPPGGFLQGFHLFSPIGINYQGGRLVEAARVAIQLAHRYGAMLVTVTLVVTAIATWRHANMAHVRAQASLVLMLLLVQASWGILNVLWQLPLWVALCHNLTALLLLLTTIRLAFLIRLHHTPRETSS